MGGRASAWGPSSSTDEERASGEERLAADALPPGTLLGKSYRLEELIGRGGAGSVYRATHLTLEREFAIKVVRASGEREARSAVRLVQEARIASKLGSDHIIDVTDLGHTREGLVYVVMELLAGEDLASRIRRQAGDPLPDAFVRRVFAEILEGLAEAHRAGVVHRDMKPANVFLATRGDRTVTKILDFGLSKVALAQDDVRLTQSGQIIGTPLYMSPEQGRGAPTDGRADIYSLGVMLYEALAGHPPFDARSALECILKHSTETPRPIGDHRPDLPPAVCAFVHDCLAKDPEMRPANVEELRERWDQAWNDVSTGPRTSGSPMRRRSLALGAVILAFATITGAVWVASDSAEAGDRSGSAEPERAESPSESSAPASPPTAPAASTSQRGTAGEPAEAGPAGEAPTPAPVRIESSPSGASVFREGERLGRTPFELSIDPSESSVTVVLRHPGHQPKRVVVQPGAPAPATVVLERRPRVRRSVPSLAPRYGED